MYNFCMRNRLWITIGFGGLVIGLAVFLFFIWQPVLKGKEEGVGIEKKFPLAGEKAGFSSVSESSEYKGAVLPAFSQTIGQMPKNGEIPSFFETEKEKISGTFIEPFSQTIPPIVLPSVPKEESHSKEAEKPKRILTDEEWFILTYPKEYAGLLEFLQNLMLGDGYIKESDKIAFKTEEDTYAVFNTFVDYAASKGYITEEKKNDFKFGINFVLKGYNARERASVEGRSLSLLRRNINIGPIFSALTSIFAPFVQIPEIHAQYAKEGSFNFSADYLSSLSDEDLTGLLGGRSGDELSSILGGFSAQQLVSIFGGRNSSALVSIFSGIGGNALSYIFGGVGASALSSIFGGMGGIGGSALSSIFGGIGGDALSSIFGGIGGSALNSIFGGIGGSALSSIFGGVGGNALSSIFGGVGGSSLSSIFSGIGGSALSSIFGGIGGNALSSIFGGIGGNAITSIFSGIGGNALTSIFGGGLGSNVLNSIFGGIGSGGFFSIFGSSWSSTLSSIFGNMGSFDFSSILGVGFGILGGSDCYREGSSMGGGYNTWAMCCNCGLYCTTHGCSYVNDCGTMGQSCTIQLGCKNLMCSGNRPVIWDQASGMCGCG